MNSATAIESWLGPVCLALITIASTVTDLKARRIPNLLTGGALLAGLVFRVSLGGWSGLFDALLGFLFGFGTFFLLWASGGGGAGDAKLMGALGVWLGRSQTIAVLATSTVFVLVLTMLAPRLQRYVPRLAIPDTEIPGTKSAAGGPKRRTTVAFAVPVALATWVVAGLQLAGIRLPLF